MKYALIAEEKTHHPVSRLAGVLDVSPAGYHAWEKRPVSDRRTQDERLKVRISEIHTASFGIYGTPRIHAELADAYGINIGKKRVARLMQELGIQGVSRRGKRRARKSTTAEAPVAPDLVKREFTATRSDELWVADITYISTWEGWLFLAAIVDVFTKRCCGWSMRNDLTSDLVVDALGMAVTLRRSTLDAIGCPACLQFGVQLKCNSLSSLDAILQLIEKNGYRSPLGAREVYYRVKDAA